MWGLLRKRLREIIIEAVNFNKKRNISELMSMTTIDSWYITSTTVTLPMFKNLGEPLYQFFLGRGEQLKARRDQTQALGFRIQL